MSDPIENFLLLTLGLCELAFQMTNALVEAYKAIPDRVLKELEVKE